MGRLTEDLKDGSNDKSRTFVFQGESHTLGNLLQSVITPYPDVLFCGYTLPHPSEEKMLLKIQVKQGTAVDALKRGLEDIEKLCDHTTKTFNESWNSYQQSSVANK